MEDKTKKIFDYLPDKIFLRIRYYHAFKKSLNLKHPRTFNEKLQWLKLNDRNSIYTQMADKYKVREYVSKKIGKQFLIPLINVWDSVEEIDFNILPDQFVLKTTHDSGGVRICKDKRKFNFEEATHFLGERMKKNYYYCGREWPYRDVKPRIIAEKYMADESNYELKDYKIFNFNGEPKFIQVDCDRFSNHKRNIYDIDWNLLNFKYNYENETQKIIEKPIVLKKMLNLARKLSENTKFLRTDFYVINDKIYFGELTFYPEAGFGKFIPESIDLEIGKLLEIE